MVGQRVAESLHRRSMVRVIRAERLLLFRRPLCGGLFNRGDDRFRQRAAIIMTGNGEQLETGSDQLLAVAKVDLSCHKGLLLGVDRLGERKRDVDRTLIGQLGRPAVFISRVEGPLRSEIRIPTVGRRAVERREAVEIHLVARHRLGADGERREHE